MEMAIALITLKASSNLPGLVEGRDGALYGIADALLFSVNKDGTGYHALYLLDGFSSGELVMGTDGAFYGTTFDGGTAGLGSVFKLWPPQTPDLIKITAANDVVQVSFDG
jgi:uncharacterized repeat protein (TIGR03803 family)